MPDFIPGLDLAERYYFGLLQPLLRQHFPKLEYAAALIGYGSEVLGFDTPMSMDHAWAPRLQLFLAESEMQAAGQIDELLRRQLPTHLLGFPLGARASDDEPGVFFMDEQTQPGQVNHKIRITCLREFIKEELDWDLRQPLEPADWLTFPSQVLRALTAGRVFYDAPRELTNLRRELAFYPRDIWLYLLACGWDRLGQEQPLMQRAGYVGDELGSALMGSRLARDLISLCFLMERQYAPYPKWFGSAFKQLPCAAEISPLLWRVKTATSWQERANALGEACVLLAHKHNDLGITAPMPEALIPFHGRPFQVIQAEKFTAALFENLSDPQIQRIAKKGPLGGIDQISDNTILRSEPGWRQALKALYA
ncbi:MAG TPA: DUF4037 domain-containing protein [Anaerolineales bacterium]|jgi:hypothetical protein